jgi:hypothetical protein
MSELVVALCKQMTRDVIERIAKAYNLDEKVMMSKYGQLTYSMVEMLDDNIVVSDTADATDTATQPYQP